MNTIKSNISKHALLTYFLLAFGITWGGILLLIGVDGILGTKAVADDVMPFVYLVTLLGPSVSGMVMIGLLEGRQGYANLCSKLAKWRFGVGWYAISLLTAPALILAILFVLSGTSADFLPAIVTTDDKTGLLILGIVMGLVVAFFEELGWSTVAVPRLRQRYGVLKSGIIMGVLWGAWHFPLFLGSTRASGTVPPALYLTILLFSFLPAYRTLMVWVYDRTGSYLMAILMHAPLTGSQLVLIPAAIAGKQLVTFDLVFGIALWVLVILVFVFQKKESLVEGGI